MKYYIYISDAKVDMLFPQVPHEVKARVASEFGIDLKIFVAKRKSESETEENRISRLEAVVAFIRDFGNLGSVQKPDEYIEDTMKMRMSLHASKEGQLVYFGGKELNTFVGLGGSVGHIVGPDIKLPDVQPHRPSSLAGMVYILGPLAKNDEIQSDLTDRVSNSVLLMTQYAEGIDENLNFMAKRLMYNPSYMEHDYKTKPKRRKVLVGSPLYVAKMD
jgi:hypothetical protein